MLERLSVKNFAIIEDIDINFKNGFNIISGETGAGKSLIIDAVKIALGARAQSSLIRYGTNEAKILASFSNLSYELIDLLKKYNIDYSNLLTIERVISKDKSYIKINSKQVTLNELKNIGSSLVNFHSQNDNLKLLNKDNYISIIDSFNSVELSCFLRDYLDKREIYLADYNALEEANKTKRETIEKLEYYKFVLNELEELNLTETLYDELDSEIKKLSNYDKIYSHILEAIESLDNEYFNLDIIYKVQSNLSKISELDKDIENFSANLANSYELLSNTLEEMKAYLSSLEYDPSYLNDLISRQKKIDNICFKYHKSYKDLLEYKDFIKEESDKSENYDDFIETLNKKLKSSFDDTINSALNLSKLRENNALKLENLLINECKDLEMQNMQFKIEFSDICVTDYLNKDIFKPHGIDDIEFMISLNLGEPMLKLADVASGGEMSRISLAFKSILSKNSNYSLFIFDEIDTGVSGLVSYKMALKIKRISENVQTLVISHMAQVQALASNVLFIYKETKNERTVTKVKSLNEEERVVELAKMISGGIITDSAITQAKEMLKN